MPVAAPKPCTICSVLVRDGGSRCPAHPKAAWVQRATYKRVTGRKLQRQRAELFAREPLCRLCSAKGFVTIATIRDHIKPLAEGGSDDDDNIQPLCLPCSDAKTEQETRRGRGRSALPLVHRQGASGRGGGGQKSGA